eukprot:6440224-Prymnesium_polylepis.1
MQGEFAELLESLELTVKDYDKKGKGDKLGRVEFDRECLDERNYVDLYEPLDTQEHDCQSVAYRYHDCCVDLHGPLDTQEYRYLYLLY